MWLKDTRGHYYQVLLMPVPSRTHIPTPTYTTHIHTNKHTLILHTIHSVECKCSRRASPKRWGVHITLYVDISLYMHVCGIYWYIYIQVVVKLIDKTNETCQRKDALEDTSTGSALVVSQMDYPTLIRQPENASSCFLWNKVKLNLDTTAISLVREGNYLRLFSLKRSPLVKSKIGCVSWKYRNCENYICIYMIYEYIYLYVIYIVLQRGDEIYLDCDWSKHWIQCRRTCSWPFKAVSRN